MTPRAATSFESGPPVEWTLKDLCTVLTRRRLWIAGALCLGCTLALLYGLFTTPRYRATAIVEVRKQSHGAFGLEDSTADAQTTAISDSFDDNLTLQTEIGILQSDALTLDVIHRTGLENTTDYFAPRREPFAWTKAVIRWLFFWQKPIEPLSIPLAAAPNRRYIALKIFAKRAKIAPAAGTRLLSISYSDPDPERSAAVVNALVQSLADYSFESQSSAATQSAAWLQSQLAELKQQTDALDAQAAALDRRAGAFGDSDAHNVVLERLDVLNASLSAAQSNRIVREAIWRAVESGDPEIISGLGGNPGIAASTQNSFALLQSLRTQEAVAKSQIAESAGRYGENWPALAEQRAGLATIEKSIQEEVHRLGDRAHSDYQVSLQAEDAARAAYDQQKGLAAGLTGDAVTLRLARQQSISVAAQALYFILIGRTLGAREYGAFIGVVALVAALAQFSSLGMEMILVRNVSRDRASFAPTWGQSLIILCAGFFLLLGAAMVFAHFALRPDLRTLVPWIALSDGLLGKLVQLASRAFQGAGRLAWTARLSALTNLCRTATAAIVWVWARAHGIHPTAHFWAHVYWLSTLTVAVVAAGLVTAQLGPPRFRRVRARDLSEGLSFSVSGSSISVYNDIDKTFLVSLGQTGAAGIYSAAYRVVDVATMPIYSVYAAAAPRFFRIGAKGAADAAAFARRTIARTLPYALIASAAMALAAPLLPLAFGPSFRESVSALRWLCLLPVFRALHYGWGSAITGAASQWNRTATQFGAAALNLALDFLLIPRWSWRGAAAASLLTDGALALASYCVLAWLVRRESAGISPSSLRGRRDDPLPR